MSVIKRKRIASQQEQKPSSFPRVVLIILVIRISLSFSNSYKGDSSMESLMFLPPCIEILDTMDATNRYR